MFNYHLNNLKIVEIFYIADLEIQIFTERLVNPFDIFAPLGITERYSFVESLIKDSNFNQRLKIHINNRNDTNWMNYKNYIMLLLQSGAKKKAYIFRFDNIYSSHAWKASRNINYRSIIHE